jgi:hypothetical protein
MESKDQNKLIPIECEDVIYDGEKKELNIEIKIIRRPHKDEDYLTKDKSRHNPNFHYYIYYSESKSNVPEPEMIIMHDKGAGDYPMSTSCVSRYVERGQKIKWLCHYPFTIYYGGTSIITTDRLGWPRPRQILPYLKAEMAEKKGMKFYETQDVYIVNNALAGNYKYFVAVYIPEGNIICVDDPETIVPPPPRK